MWRTGNRDRARSKQRAHAGNTATGKLSEGRGALSQWGGEGFLGIHQSRPAEMDKLTCMEAMVEQVLTCRRFRADRRRRAVGLVIVLSVIVGVRAWSAPPSSEMPISRLPMATPQAQEPIVPLPLTIDQNPAKVALGERLFHDVRLSRDNSLSCATCHQLEQGGDDGLSRSMDSPCKSMRLY